MYAQNSFLMSLFSTESATVIISSSICAIALGCIITSMLPSASVSVVSERNLFGSQVKVEIDPDCFPTEAQIEALDKKMPGCQHGYFTSAAHGNAMLHYRYWLPKGEVKGVAVFFHGITAHGGRGLVIDGRKLCSSLLSDLFIEEGIALYALDMYGHGFSEGTRFYIKNWEFNKQDCIDFAHYASGQHSKSLPLFLSGESLGGCLAIHAAKHFQDNPGSSNLDSILLSAPAIHGDLPSFPVYHILRYVFAPLIPRRTPFFMPHPLPADRVWRDEKPMKHFTNSEYSKFALDDGASKLRLGTALGCVLAMEEVCSEVIPEFNVPFCTIHGTKDEGVPIEGSKFMMETAQTPEKDRKLFCMEGATHDLLADPDVEVALGHWITFVKKRIKMCSVALAN